MLSVRLQEHSAEQLRSMKAEHLRTLDQLRANHALEHSRSKVADLANKLNTQEVRTHQTFTLMLTTRPESVLLISMLPVPAGNSGTFAGAAERAAGSERCADCVTNQRGRSAEAGSG